MKKVLISVSDKRGIKEFVKGLVECGYGIIATDGTKSYLENEGIDSERVSDITAFPEILRGRVKTLHPKIYGGILSVRDEENDMEELEEHSIDKIDMVVVNLYPFGEVIKREEVDEREIIENIDIGGVSLIRAGAKNYKDVIVITDPDDYMNILADIREKGELTVEKRERLAMKGFLHTAEYDRIISGYFSKKIEGDFPEKLNLSYEKVMDLRYGENSHQRGALYKDISLKDGIMDLKQLNGKELSYNNIKDIDAVLNILREFEEPTVVGLKHMNPCGVGSGENIFEAWKKAYEGDKVSIFGGIVAFNREVNKEIAEELSKLFLEVVIAPSFNKEGLELLKAKKNLRILEGKIENRRDYEMVSIDGGILIQEKDNVLLGKEGIRCVTKKEATEEEIEELLFSWKVVKGVKSNGIVVSRNRGTIGIGAGQMNRVGSAKIALEQGGDRCNGAVLASDGFFPMPDTVQLAIEYGIKAIIQPGGSIKDSLSIEECDKHGIAMIFTDMRHFKH